MKIKILAVLAVVTVVIVSMFMREKREDPSSLVMMNVEALATGEGTSPAMCVGYGSVVCPNDGSISLSFGNLYWVHFRFAERSDVVCFFS